MMFCTPTPRRENVCQLFFVKWRARRHLRFFFSAYLFQSFVCPLVSFVCVPILFVCVPVLFVCVPAFFVCVPVLFVCVPILFVCVSALFYCVPVSFVCVPVLFICVSFLLIFVPFLFVCVPVSFVFVSSFVCVPAFVHSSPSLHPPEHFEHFFEFFFFFFLSHSLTCSAGQSKAHTSLLEKEQIFFQTEMPVFRAEMSSFYSDIEYKKIQSFLSLSTKITFRFLILKVLWVSVEK